MLAKSANLTNQTKQPIEMHKKYKTRDGRPVRILCVDFKSESSLPVIALVTTEEGNEGVYCYHSDGKLHCKLDYDTDLIEVQPWDDFKIDDPVLVSDDGVDWYRRHFAGINEEGLPLAFGAGMTSFTVDTQECVTVWNFCKKPDQE